MIEMGHSEIVENVFKDMMLEMRIVEKASTFPPDLSLCLYILIHEEAERWQATRTLRIASLADHSMINSIATTDYLKPLGHLLQLDHASIVHCFKLKFSLVHHT